MKAVKTGRRPQGVRGCPGRQPDAAHYRLRLFVTGTTPRSARAIQNIRALCEEKLHGRYDLEVIDIYQHPEHGKPEQIVVTPTLVKKLPLPVPQDHRGPVRQGAGAGRAGYCPASSLWASSERAAMAPEAREDLLERIRDLQQRLDEAEETLRALRSGEVDAVVASGPDGDRVYTLKGADEAYRVMVQNMAEGALTLTPRWSDPLLQRTVRLHARDPAQ